ncbi:hypothetical protein [Nostoc sp. UHCC 0870]|uniref:hypothetical protein n=1 Tax=Nostoc sp. UHCC 0870 TaxID=2914041 RepID=UPI001EE09DE3|nr:hypothetical protein [Nostoc sp. UHCC 0870]UKP01441.1 hypothetical protein L6494_29890 [Nostoc sp. UHCC 0870]
MFGCANSSDEITPVKSIMACIVAIKIAPHIHETHLISYLQCVDNLNNLLLNYRVIQDGEEKNEIKKNIRDIGESLDKMGGHKLMELTCTYLTPNYNLAIITEKIWGGIGGHWYP